MLYITQREESREIWKEGASDGKRGGDGKEKSQND
jgi:hypothetical protein